MILPTRPENFVKKEVDYSCQVVLCTPYQEDFNPVVNYPVLLVWHSVGAEWIVRAKGVYKPWPIWGEFMSAVWHIAAAVCSLLWLQQQTHRCCPHPIWVVFWGFLHTTITFDEKEVCWNIKIAVPFRRIRETNLCKTRPEEDIILIICLIKSMHTCMKISWVSREVSDQQNCS